MAESKIAFKFGYDVEVIEDYPSKLNCIICTYVIKHATHGCENHVFCKLCVNNYAEHHNIRNEDSLICPGGCKEEIDPENLQPNLFVDLLIKTLKTKCLNDSCSWQGYLIDLVEVHRMNCDHVKVNCANLGCQEMFSKQDVDKHDEICLYKSIQCCYCDHTIIKINKEKHEETCLPEVVACEYHSIGCNIKVAFLIF